MTKIREIIEKYAEEDDCCEIMTPTRPYHIYEDDFNALEKDLEEYCKARAIDWHEIGKTDEKTK